MYPHKRDRGKAIEFANYGHASDESADFGQYKLEETEEVNDDKNDEFNSIRKKIKELGEFTIQKETVLDKSPESKKVRR